MKIIPIMISVEKDKQIGIEYLNGKYVLFGKEYMDEGVNLLFKKLIEYLETMGTFVPNK